MSQRDDIFRGFQNQSVYDDVRDENARFYNEQIKPFVEDLFPSSDYEEPFFYTQESRNPGELSTALYRLADKLDVPEEQAYVLAGAAELGAGNTLVIDDIIDNDEVRYGRNSAWKEFGIDEALLAAGMVQEDLHLMMSNLNNEAHKSVTEGFENTYQSWFKEKEIKDSSIDEVSRDDLYSICQSKTAIGTGSLRALGILAGLETEEIATLEEYGLKKGTAWQISNDLEEIAGDDRDNNHRDYSDLLNGYPTIPMLIGWNNMNLEDRKRFEGNFPSENIDEAEKAINLLKENNAYVDSIMHGEELLEEADEGLNEVHADASQVLERFSPVLWP